MLNSNLSTIFLRFKRNNVSYITNDTLEICPSFISFKKVTPEIFKNLPFYNYRKAHKIFNFLKKNEFNNIIDNYDLTCYQEMMMDFNTLLKYVQLQNQKLLLETRQLSITFPSWHCFQFIQFLIRNGTININVGMRSCNIFDNLMIDIFIVYQLGLLIGRAFNAQGKGYIKRYDISFYIGSLHLYKKDYINFKERIDSYVVRNSQTYTL